MFSDGTSLLHLQRQCHSGCKWQILSSHHPDQRPWLWISQELCHGCQSNERSVPISDRLQKCCDKDTRCSGSAACIQQCAVSSVPIWRTACGKLGWLDYDSVTFHLFSCMSLHHSCGSLQGTTIGEVSVYDGDREAVPSRKLRLELLNGESQHHFSLCTYSIQERLW